MAFVVEFDIPTEAYLQFQDKIIWEKIKDISIKELKKYLFKFIRSKGYRVYFKDLKKEAAEDEVLLGLNHQPDHKISICSTQLSISELPAVIIHECFHSIFNQLENEDYIRTLEKKVVSSLTIKEANRLLREVFSRGEFFGPIAKRVGEAKKARIPRSRNTKKSTRKISKN
jgi:hypothetical protein